jgi:hypothetical protein
MDESNVEELITLREAAVLAGVSAAELRRYVSETNADGTPRLRTVRIGKSPTAPHYTRAEWVAACMANRKQVKSTRPAPPILTGGRTGALAEGYVAPESEGGA